MLFNKKTNINWIRGEKTKINIFLSHLGLILNINEQDIFNKRQEMKSIEDTFWSFCNKNLLKYQEKNDYSKLQSIYSYMIYLERINGRDNRHLIKRRMYFQLLEDSKKNSIDLVIPICSENSCEECKKFDGVEMSFHQALEKQPLHSEKCTCPNDCDCIYL